MLEGFQVYTTVVGSPSIAVTKNGIGVNKTAVVRLGNASYVQILFNKKDRVMAIKKCEKDDDGAVPFARSVKREGARWNNRELTKRVSDMAGISSDTGFKVEGEAFEDEGYVIFDLKKAVADE